MLKGRSVSWRWALRDEWRSRTRRWNGRGSYCTVIILQPLRFMCPCAPPYGETYIKAAEALLSPRRMASLLYLRHCTTTCNCLSQIEVRFRRKHGAIRYGGLLSASTHSSCCWCYENKRKHALFLLIPILSVSTTSAINANHRRVLIWLDGGNRKSHSADDISRWFHKSK